MDATVKVLCYKSKTLADGKHPLMVCICKDNPRIYNRLLLNILYVINQKYGLNL